MAAILIVDDSAVSRRMLAFVLKNHGYTVGTAVNGRDALEHIDRQAFDLIIADLSMPEMDGITLLKHIRADARTQDLPFIMLTASGVDRDRVAARAEGADGFLTKPSSSWELLETVKQTLESRTALGPHS